MSPSSELNKKLKMCEPEIRLYVAELQLENAKLQRQIAKFEVEKVSSNNRIIALQKELKKNTPATKVIIKTTPELKKLMED